MSKRLSVLRLLGNWLLLFCGTLGAPMCLVTAYHLPYHLRAVIICALIISGFMTLLFALPELGVYMLLPFGVTVILISIFRWRMLYSGALLALSTVQGALSQTVSFIPAPADVVSDAASYASFIGFFLGALMVALSLLMAWGLISGESLFLPLLVPMPLVALSLLYVDMQPAPWTGVLLCLYYGAVLITGGLRLHQGEGVGSISLLALGVLLLGLLALMRIFPQENYTPQDTQKRIEQLQTQAATWWERASRTFTRDISQREDLSREGERKSTGEQVFEVRADVTGRLYLRGISYGGYDGRYWSITGEYPQGESLYTLGGNLPPQESGVAIRNADSVLLYSPYALVKTDSTGEVRENYIQRRDAPSNYGWIRRELPGYLSPRQEGAAAAAYSEWAQQTYTSLPAKTRLALLSFLQGYDLPDPSDPLSLAQALTAIIQSQATYDLEPGAFPANEDFVLYFLTKSHRGYCVHYASALCALLQAMEVPARFVTGYALTVPEARTWTKVTDKNAHAWVEVYVNGWGWVPVEATGGNDAGLDDPAPAADSQGDQPNTPEPTQTPTPAPDAPLTEAPTESPTEEPTAEPTPEPSPEPTPEHREGEGAVTPSPEPEPSKEPPPLEEPEEQNKQRRLSWLWLLLLPLLAAGGWYLRRLICRRREQRMKETPARSALLYAYGELLQLVQHGATLPPEATALAQEAAFSRHAMGPKQAGDMAAFVFGARRELTKNLPWYRLWFLRYILWLW
ncbi:MAG: hypothetical protein IJR17_05060 [Clostridia bacterium]|nr:hypothetical protein [Clostridia bacterium]